MRRIAPSIMLLLVMVACTDAALEKTSKALLGTGKAIETVQVTVIKANDLKLVSDDATRNVLEICVKASLAGKQGVAITRAITVLTPEARLQIRQIIQPVVMSIQASLLTDIAGIQDPAARIQVETAVTALQSAFTAVILAIEIGG